MNLVTVGLTYNADLTRAHRFGLSAHDGFTGHVYWQSDVNGFTTPVYGDLAKLRFFVSNS